MSTVDTRIKLNEQLEDAVRFAMMHNVSPSEFVRVAGYCWDLVLAEMENKARKEWREIIEKVE